MKENCRMGLTVVNVAYPLAPVGPHAIGGAEQILSMIDRALVAQGHRSIVIAAEGSHVAGELIATPRPPEPLDSKAHALALTNHRRQLAALLARERVDVVHLHGHDFAAYLPPSGVPTLVTLHLPPELLLVPLTAVNRAHTWAHGVSRSQHERLPRVSFLLPPIENGVAVDELRRAGIRRARFVAAMGRICPEKGFHHALEAARRAERPLLLGGTVFPYYEHQRYFHTELAPRLDAERRFIGPVGPLNKRRLLNAAACLLVTSIIPETSSLVAMEALACGTPVISFASGALPEIVEHGVTGFIVNDVAEMADAIREIDRIDREACRAAACRRFSAACMTSRYFERYRWMLDSASLCPSPILS
jgi:glycosyltransferase involved in cell wall biosynthesis